MGGLDLEVTQPTQPPAAEAAPLTLLTVYRALYWVEDHYFTGKDESKKRLVNVAWCEAYLTKRGWKKTIPNPLYVYGVYED